MHFQQREKYLIKIMVLVQVCILMGWSTTAIAEIDSAFETSQADTVYEQSYFQDYQPVTLRDMIRVIPGGLNLLKDLGQWKQSRGLGSDGEQILIDGKRMSGKSNDISARLSRIQASQVVRIELLRNTAEGLDIRSEGTILNIVLNKEAATDYYAELMTQYNDKTGQLPEVLLTNNGSVANLDYTIGYHYDTWLRFHNEFEHRLENNPLNQEYRYLGKDLEVKRHTFTANSKYNLSSGDAIQLNAYYRDERRLTEQTEEQLDAISDLLLANEEQTLDYNQTRWELGADYETDIENLGNLKTLLVVSRTSNTNTIIQDEIVQNTTDRLFTFLEDSVQTERIIRLNLSKAVFTNQTIEYGGEAAFNQLIARQSFDLADFEASDVEEDRYEMFVTYSVPMTEQLNLQFSLNREQSSIVSDSLGFQNQRRYDFWKPRIELRYDLNENNQMRLLSEKSASQLNLRNFIARRNTDDDTIDLGNPFLRPETTERILLGFEHRFDNDNGSINLELFSDDIQDHISQAPLIDGGTGTGNIGAAKGTGFNFESNFNLDSLGLNDALISFSYEYRDTEADDPFLNEVRPLNNVPLHSYFLDYRHDIPEYNLVYGFSAHKRTSMYRTNITLYEIRHNDIHVSEFFLEYALAAGMRLRAEMRNPLNDTKYYNKTFYVDNIADQIIDRTEFRETNVRPTFAIKFQASF